MENHAPVGLPTPVRPPLGAGFWSNAESLVGASVFWMKSSIERNRPRTGAYLCIRLKSSNQGAFTSGQRAKTTAAMWSRSIDSAMFWASLR